jgi:hypothetical protein
MLRPSGGEVNAGLFRRLTCAQTLDSPDPQELRGQGSGSDMLNDQAAGVFPWLLAAASYRINSFRNAPGSGQTNGGKRRHGLMS